MRQLKREVKIGNVTIGGKNPIAVQTMLNVPVEDIEGNVAQAKRCEAAGCQILRVTCPSAADARCIEAVKNAVNIPIVADIHFDYKLCTMSTCWKSSTSTTSSSPSKIPTSPA